MVWPGGFPVVPTSWGCDQPSLLAILSKEQYLIAGASWLVTDHAGARQPGGLKSPKVREAVTLSY
jgi:hypothetical protein